ncbi:1-phosphofructokinase family hexose kinase [Diplocloster modestus]|uniref:Tagatose-6-phosphate kinase n=1 Tax=Diplocloster modestus TaxID=2850322 RepID=A0ABS6K8M1_9FIRM|nr:1-phosphofructokinase family hexose kinase [Diplocloster modestus]MBU9726861.1 1-phosphofructokinase family hexose kinase [Diplocloster modestus]
MINTVTLNPAVDRILYIPSFTRNITNRIRSTKDYLGGKGTHVSINLKLLNTASRAFGIAYGDTGKKVIQFLKDFQIDVQFIYEDKGETRTNYLVIEDTNDCSIIADRGMDLAEGILERLIHQMRMNLKEEDYLVLSGDASNCSDPMVYNRIMKELSDKRLRVFLDTSGESLMECIRSSPYLIKPNLDELSYISKKNLSGDEEIIQALKELDPYQVEIIAVSLGGDGSLVKYRDEFYRVYPPRVRVSNTIGCGDCYLAGLVYGIHEGKNIAETLRIATAASAAAAESNTSVGFDTDRAKQLENLVTIKKLA